MWRLGQLSPAQLNLVPRVEPPDYILVDEKHTRETGDQACAPMIYEASVALIWWIDCLDSASEEALPARFERFKAIEEQLAHVLGARVDGWESTQNALLSAFEGITLI